MRAIEQALRPTFLPTALDRALLTAVHEVAGFEAVDIVVRRAMTRSFETPMLRPFVEGARSVFGMTPLGVLRVACRGYASMHRHNGVFVLGDHGERQAMVRFEGGHADVVADHTCMHAYRAVLQAVLALSCTTHTVNTVSNGVADFCCQW